MHYTNHLRHTACKKAPELQTAHTGTVEARRGGLDRGSFPLHSSPAVPTTLPLFDVENNVLSILHKVLFKPKFHSLQLSPCNQLSLLAISRGKFWKTTAESPGKSILLLEQMKQTQILNSAFCLCICYNSRRIL